MAPIKKSEEEVGRIWDRCFVDTSIKAVSGAVVGSIFSLLFFKRKAWPVTLGLGVGLGAGYTNCRQQFWWRRQYPHPQGQGFNRHRPSFWRPPFRRDDAPDKQKEASLPSADTAPAPAPAPAPVPAEVPTENKPSDS